MMMRSLDLSFDFEYATYVMREREREIARNEKSF